MPAVSQAQQKIMGMVHAYKKGDLDLKSLPKGVQDQIKKIASTIKAKDAKDYAKTDRKGLPYKVPKKKKEESIRETIRGIVRELLSENTLTDLPNTAEYGYTRDGVVQCIASKNTCITRIKHDRLKNPGSKFQLVYRPNLVVGESLTENFDKIYKKYDSKDYWQMKPIIKNKVDWLNDLQANDGERASQEYQPKDVKMIMKLNAKDVEKGMRDSNKKKTKEMYDDLVRAIKQGSLGWLKSHIRHDQVFMKAAYQDITGVKLPKSTRDIHKLFNEKYGKSVTEADTKDEIAKIYVGGQLFWIRKGDATHFYMSPNEKKIKAGAEVFHIGQHKDELYYKDIVNWLKGGKINGKKYKKFFRQN